MSTQGRTLWAAWLKTLTGVFSVPAAAQQIMLGPQLQAPGGGGSSHALAGSGRRHLMAPQPTTISASLQPGPGQVWGLCASARLPDWCWDGLDQAHMQGFEHGLMSSRLSCK